MNGIEELLNSGFLSDQHGVDATTRQILASEEFTEIICFDQDTLIISQASHPDALYFTLDGIFHAISHANPDAPHRLLGRIEPGQFIGELCLVDPNSRASASVKALRNSMALKMKADTFEQMRAAHPQATLQFLLAISKQLANRLRSANEKVL